MITSRRSALLLLAAGCRCSVPKSCENGPVCLLAKTYSSQQVATQARVLEDELMRCLVTGRLF